MQYTHSLKLTAVAAAVTLMAACSSVPVNMSPTDTFPAPAETLVVDKVGKFSDSDTILVPSIYLHLLAKGTYKQSKGGAHAKVHFGVNNLSEEMGQALATEIHQDLVNKLQQSGWNVLTYQDTQNQDWEDIGRDKKNDELGTYGHDMNKGYGKQYWMTFSPKGVPVFDPVTFGEPGTPDIHDIHRTIARKVDANLLFPVYRFNSPIPYGETSRGYKKNRAEANVMPGLDFAGATSGQYSVKGAWGSVNLTQPQRLSENVGQLSEVSSSTEKNYTLFTSDVFRSISKGDYAMSLDEEKYKSAILKAAKDYNSSLVDAFKGALKSK